jgi:hypothetical protein
MNSMPQKLFKIANIKPAYLDSPVSPIVKALYMLPSWPHNLQPYPMTILDAISSGFPMVEMTLSFSICKYNKLAIQTQSSPDLLTLPFLSNNKVCILRQPIIN